MAYAANQCGASGAWLGRSIAGRFIVDPAEEGLPSFYLQSQVCWCASKGIRFSACATSNLVYAAAVPPTRRLHPSDPPRPLRLQERLAAQCSKRFLGVPLACGGAAANRVALYSNSSAAEALLKWQFEPLCAEEGALCTEGSLDCCPTPNAPALKCTAVPGAGKRCLPPRGSVPGWAQLLPMGKQNRK